MPRKHGPIADTTSRTVTIREVADAASVSIATVSYVLNNTPGQVITDRTQQRVRTAATELGYVPHGLARALREGMSRIVLLNTGSLMGGHSLDSFIAGMSAELHAFDFTLLATTDPSGVIPADAIPALAPRAVLDLPRMLADDPEADPLFGAIDGYQAGLAFHTRTQLRHLVDRGHRNIAFALPQNPTPPLAAARADHVTRIAAELGCETVSKLHIDMGDDPEPRREAVRALLDRTSATAVAAYSDDVALGVLGALGALGLHAPSDLAVIGFDDGWHGRLWQPALTTVRIDAAGFGRRAARFVLGLDPGEWVQPPSEVIVRQTT